MMRRVMSVILALVISLLPLGTWDFETVRAETSAIEALLEQIDALDAEAMDLYAHDGTFMYKGETYSMEDGIDYANTYLANTEEYYPFCDALQQACIARSNEIGELFLQIVELRNEYAALLGYDNYLEYNYDLYGVDESEAQIILQALVDYFPKTLDFIAENEWMTGETYEEIPLEEEEFMHQAAAFYGKILPNYQILLEELVDSDALFLEKLDDQPQGSEVVVDVTRDHPVSVHLRYADMLYFSVNCVHEFGHYLHDIQVLNADTREYYAIYETHSCAGSLLCAADVERYFRERYGDADGTFCTLIYLIESVNLLWTTALYYPILKEIYLHPESYEPEDIAQRFLEQNLSLGYDAGYSEAYLMLLGTSWYNFYNGLDMPAYLPAYAIGYTHAIWLWHEQESGGNAAEIYNELLCTEIPDVSMEEFCRQVGLPDFTDPATYADLDDFVYEKMASLYTEAFGEAPV